MLEEKDCLYIRLPGSPEVSRGGIPLALNQLKSRALLYYLAATGVAHTRDHLATPLWSESGQSRAYHSLRMKIELENNKFRVVGRANNYYKLPPNSNPKVSLLIANVLDIDEPFQ